MPNASAHWVRIRQCPVYRTTTDAALLSVNANDHEDARCALASARVRSSFLPSPFDCIQRPSPDPMAANGPVTHPKPSGCLGLCFPGMD